MNNGNGIPNLASMIWQNQVLMMMTLFSSLMTAFMTSFFKFLGEKINSIYDSWKVPKKKLNTNQIILEREIITRIDNGHTTDTNANAFSYIQAMIAYIAEHQPDSASSRIEIVQETKGQILSTDREKYLARHSRVIPDQPFEVDGFIIDCKITRENTDKDGKVLDVHRHIYKIIISSQKPTKKITAFLEEIHEKWVKQNYPEMPQKKIPLYEYSLIPIEKENGAIIFNRYPIDRNLGEWDILLFDGKATFERLLETYRSGEMTRVGFMLDGEPGGGKTSLVRSTAIHENCDVFVLNLSDIKSDAQLKQIVNEESIIYREQGLSNYTTVPLNKRIYFIDEADCGSNVLMDRELLARREELRDAKFGCINKSSLDTDEKTEADNIKTSVTAKAASKEFEIYNASKKLTLRGVLDVLDGLIQMRGILFINTNRPDEIDDAIKRDGRIDLRLTLGRLTGEQVVGVMKRYGITPKMKIPDRVLMGCNVRKICKIAKANPSISIDKLLNDEIAEQVAMAEKKRKEAIKHAERVSKLASESQHMPYSGWGKSGHINSAFKNFSYANEIPSS